MHRFCVIIALGVLAAAVPLQAKNRARIAHEASSGSRIRQNPGVPSWAGPDSGESSYERPSVRNAG